MSCATSAHMASPPVQIKTANEKVRKDKEASSIFLRVVRKDIPQPVRRFADPGESYLLLRPIPITPPSAPCSAGIPDFLHGWRRRVCRGCTGHLVLVKRELPARLRFRKPPENTSKTNTNPNHNHPKATPKEKTATWDVAQKAVSAKLRGSETGAMNSALTLSTS